MGPRTDATRSTNVVKYNPALLTGRSQRFAVMQSSSATTVTILYCTHRVIQRHHNRSAVCNLHTKLVPIHSATADAIVNEVISFWLYIQFAQLLFPSNSTACFTKKQRTDLWSFGKSPCAAERPQLHNVHCWVAKSIINLSTMQSFFQLVQLQ